MAKYNVTWAVDGGREGLWRTPLWLGVLKVIGQHEGEEVHNQTSPIYAELQSKFPDETWWKTDRDGSGSLFRDYVAPWTKTGVLEPPDQTAGRFRLTSLGRQIVLGAVSPSQVFTNFCIHHEEGGERPFAILADAFLKSGRPLAVQELYHGVMGNYRPGTDDLETALAGTATTDLPATGTSGRRFKNLLDVLSSTGGIQGDTNKKTWEAWDYDTLKTIAATTQPTGTLAELRALPKAAFASFDAANFVCSQETIRRFAAALLAKRFVILTGLSGSGKTRLATLFAQWLGGHNSGRYDLVAVGADWTSNENIVGYASAFDPSAYVMKPALETMLQAGTNDSNPFFLILDEMNLSHVERYFADYLSVIESQGLIHLHDGPGNRNNVPPAIELPSNLFTVGTVNVDETTYMFSPKVLDRANVIDFVVDESDLASALSRKGAFDSAALSGKGAPYEKLFRKAMEAKSDLDDELEAKAKIELRLFWSILDVIGFGFAYRTVAEVRRFLYFYSLLGDSTDFRTGFDAQILQKLLPKVHGSRKAIHDGLSAIAAACFIRRDWSGTGASVTLANLDKITVSVREHLNQQAATGEIEDWLERATTGAPKYAAADAEYATAFRKCLRMLALVKRNGFSSFAEA